MSGSGAARSDSEFDVWLGNLWTTVAGRSDLAPLDLEELTDAWTSWRTAYTLGGRDLSAARARAEAVAAKVLSGLVSGAGTNDPVA